MNEIQIGEYTIEEMADGTYKITKPAWGEKVWITVIDGGDLETFLAPIFAGSDIHLHQL